MFTRIIRRSGQHQGRGCPLFPSDAARRQPGEYDGQRQPRVPDGSRQYWPPYREKVGARRWRYGLPLVRSVDSQSTAGSHRHRLRREQRLLSAQGTCARRRRRCRRRRAESCAAANPGIRTDVFRHRPLRHSTPPHPAPRAVGTHDPNRVCDPACRAAIADADAPAVLAPGKFSSVAATAKIKAFAPHPTVATW